MTREFVRFVFNLFSIHLFLRTLFKPMLSLQGTASGEELLIDSLSIVLGNFVMRILGFIVRTILIVMGLALIIVTTIFMIALIIIWTFLPALLVMSVYSLIAVLLQ